MSSALQTESTKLRNENCTIYVKRTRINNILIFNIFKIKWPKSEEKINVGRRWVWLSESSPTQNFVVTPWPWPHLCRPAAAASANPESGLEPNRVPSRVSSLESSPSRSDAWAEPNRASSHAEQGFESIKSSFELSWAKPRVPTQTEPNGARAEPSRAEPSLAESGVLSQVESGTEPRHELSRAEMSFEPSRTE